MMIKSWVKVSLMRWLKRPLFILLSLGLPLVLLLLSNHNQEISLPIGIYVSSADSYSQQIIETLKVNDTVFVTESYDSVDQLKKAFYEEKIVCAFEINRDWIADLNRDIRDDLFVTYHKEDNFIAPICKEKFASVVMEVYAHNLVEEVLAKQEVSATILAEAKQLFPSFTQENLTFSFDFVTYEKSDSQLFPMRQILMFWLFLVAVLAVFDYQKAQQQNIFSKASIKYYQRWLLVFMPIVLVGLIHFIFLYLHSKNLKLELQFFSLSVLWSFVLGLVLNNILKKPDWLMSGLTILTLVNLVVLPIWMNLRTIFSWFNWVQRFYPWYWIYGFFGNETGYLAMILVMSVVVLVYDRLLVKA